MTCCCKRKRLSPGFLYSVVGSAPPPDDVARKITELVTQAGGDVNGYFRVSMFWSSWSDLDLEVTENIESSSGNEHVTEKISYNNKTSKYTDGTLDVDMNIGSEEPSSPDPAKKNPAVENIIYKKEEDVEFGKYTVSYTQYGVDEGRSADGDLPYFLIEIRKSENVPMQNFVLLRAKGTPLVKGENAEIVGLEYTEDHKMVIKELGRNVEIIKIHNFDSELPGR